VAIPDAFGVVGGEEADRRVGIGGAKVDLAAGPSRLVEGGGGRGTEGESVELRLRKRRYVYVR
jgi:hypothetical protein